MYLVCGVFPISNSYQRNLILRIANSVTKLGYDAACGCSKHHYQAIIIRSPSPLHACDWRISAARLPDLSLGTSVLVLPWVSTRCGWPMEIVMLNMLNQRARCISVYRNAARRR